MPSQINSQPNKLYRIASSLLLAVSHGCSKPEATLLQFGPTEILQPFCMMNVRPISPPGGRRARRAQVQWCTVTRKVKLCCGRATSRVCAKRSPACGTIATNRTLAVPQPHTVHIAKLHNSSLHQVHTKYQQPRRSPKLPRAAPGKGDPRSAGRPLIWLRRLSDHALLMQCVCFLAPAIQDCLLYAD